MRGLLLVLLVAVGGCTVPAGVFPEPPSPIAGQIDAKQLLTRLDARYEELRTFRALADMRYEGPRERLHVKEVVVVERPDRLRIEMMSTFGVALQIASNGDRLSAWHRGERTFYRGEATPRNLARFTRLEIGVRDVADLLVGLPPARERKGKPKIASERQTGLWRVTVELEEGGRGILWFDQESLLPVRTEEVDEEGDRRYLTTYGDYRTVDGFTIPHSVGLEIPTHKTTIELKYSSIKVNEPVTAELFAFDPPVGSKVVDLDG